MVEGAKEEVRRRAMINLNIHTQDIARAHVRPISIKQVKLLKIKHVT